jgi:hypothetical protein
MKLEALLVALLAEWRKTHDQALEPLIERIGADVARLRGPLTWPPRKLEMAWLALAEDKDSADVDRLLDTTWPSAVKPMRARVAALAAFEPDPRITRTLATLAPRFLADIHQPLQKEIVRVMVSAPTAAIAAAVDKLARSPYGKLYAPAQQAFDALERRTARAKLIAEANQNAAPQGDLETLWSQHRAKPGDLEVRAVLADALTAANDPRGEFITAQLAIASGRSTPQLVKRANELLGKHLTTWMGAVPYSNKYNVTFERGFPVHVYCSTDAARLVQSADAPAWVTVEELEFSHYDELADISPLLAKLPLLRTLSAHPDIVQLVVKTGACPSIRTLDLRHYEWWPERKHFPALEVLAGAWTIESDADAKRNAQTAAKLGVTIVHTSMKPERVARIAAHRRFGPPETRLAYASVHIRDPHWCIRLRRDDAVADMAWAGPTVRAYEDDLAVTTLDALLDAGIETIRLYTKPRAKFPKLDAAVKRLARKATITRDGAPIV